MLHTAYILNQLPNATRNIFLNNSKPTECRLIPFKPWLDKWVRHSIVEFERSVWFHAHTIAFCVMVPRSENVPKKKAENNIFQFSLTLLKCFTTLKWLKVLKLSKRCFKMIKNSRSEHLVSQRTDRLNLHSRFNECGINLQILINNYLWINLVSKRHLRPWYAKSKRSVDDPSQKIGRIIYLQGTVMH